jgi:hypothetical protein
MRERSGGRDLVVIQLDKEVDVVLVTGETLSV